MFNCCCRLAFERTLELDPRSVGALVGLAILELNSKQVWTPLILPSLPSLFPSSAAKSIHKEWLNVVGLISLAKCCWFDIPG